MTTIFTSSMDDDLPPKLSRWSPGPGRRDGHDRRQPEDGGDPGEKPVIVLSAKNLAILATIISFAFTAGYNWHLITSLKAEYDQHVVLDRAVHTRFTLREVSEAQFSDIQRQLTDIKALVEQQMRERGKR